MRAATIDIGTNSTLLLVADVCNGQIKPVLERCEITRLGRGVSASGWISKEGMDETALALSSYAGDCKKLGVEKVKAVTTSAMRDASNRDEVVKEFLKNGVEVEVIPGDREAALTFESAVRDFGGNEQIAVIDVGGGSTEVIVGGFDGIRWRRSFDVGVVRARERFLENNLCDPARHAVIETWAAKNFCEIPKVKVGLAVAIAGTPTTLVAIKNGILVWDRSKVHGEVLSAADIRGLGATLGQLEPADRIGVFGLDPKRSDVIDSGASILLAAMQALGAESITVSDGGVRWGLMWELASDT